MTPVDRRGEVPQACILFQAFSPFCDVSFCVRVCVISSPPLLNEGSIPFFPSPFMTVLGGQCKHLAAVSLVRGPLGGLIPSHKR